MQLGLQEGLRALPSRPQEANQGRQQPIWKRQHFKEKRQELLDLLSR